MYLIGAGPGDPGLFTLKGRRILERADVVVYDRLLGQELLGWIREDALTIYVGKASGNHAVSQEGINEILFEHGARGMMVARLKGGDPFVFGRGGEEALYLQERGIPFEIVPGVTSAIAVPAYAGIPVSHRDISSSFAVITGHEKPGKSQSSINWEHLGKAVDTLVFLMGVENLPYIRRQLLDNSMDPQTPAALVKWGTLPGQQAVAGTLENIEQKVAESGLTSPAVIVVGGTVGLRERLNWFEKAPLFGKRIIVTRSRAQASQLAARLRELGGDAIEIPAIEIEKAADMSPLHRAFEQIQDYQWLVFTSVNGVQIFFEELLKTSRDIRMLAGLKIAAIGPATAEALQTKGLRVDLVPAEFKAEDMLESLKDLIPAGHKLLLPRAEGARRLLPEGLRSLGVLVDEVITYRSRRPRLTEREQKALRDGSADYITFTSSSTVENFVTQLGADRVKDFQSGVRTACIGPITAAKAVDMGFEVHVTASEYTIQGLVEAILKDIDRT